MAADKHTGISDEDVDGEGKVKYINYYNHQMLLRFFNNLARGTACSHSIYDSNATKTTVSFG